MNDEEEVQWTDEMDEEEADDPVCPRDTPPPEDPKPKLPVPVKKKYEIYDEAEIDSRSRRKMKIVQEKLIDKANTPGFIDKIPYERGNRAIIASIRQIGEAIATTDQAPAVGQGASVVNIDKQVVIVIKAIEQKVGKGESIEDVLTAPYRQLDNPNPKVGENGEWPESG